MPWYFMDAFFYFGILDNDTRTIDAIWNECCKCFDVCQKRVEYFMKFTRRIFDNIIESNQRTNNQYDMNWSFECRHTKSWILWRGGWKGTFFEKCCVGNQFNPIHKGTTTRRNTTGNNTVKTICFEKIVDRFCTSNF